MGLDLNGSWPILWSSGSPPVSTRIIKVASDSLFKININQHFNIKLSVIVKISVSD
jgi:hypothetical protein